MDEYTKALYIVSDDKDVSTAYIDPSIGEYEFSVEPVPKNLQKIKRGYQGNAGEEELP